MILLLYLSTFTLTTIDIDSVILLWLIRRVVLDLCQPSFGPERFLVSLYPMGMVRQMSKDSFRSYWDFMQRMAEDLSQQYDDDTVMYLE